MPKTSLNIAVVGATGVVGKALIKGLEKVDLPIGQCHFLASHDSAGKTVFFRGNAMTILDAHRFDFDGVDVAFFSAGSAVSETLVPVAVQAGALVIDNTSHFRGDSSVPLIVPEVNGDLLTDLPESGIIANPNCSTIQLVVALKPLLALGEPRRLVVSTYQSQSGAGHSAMERLMQQTQRYFAGVKNDPLHVPAAFNVSPVIDDLFDEHGYSIEELKMENETRRLLGREDLAVSATCVRVPTLVGHGESVSVEFDHPIDLKVVKKLWNKAPGLDYSPESLTPFHAEGDATVRVGRLRSDSSDAAWIHFWVVADNVLKGAATNALQIAELLKLALLEKAKSKAK